MLTCYQSNKIFSILCVIVSLLEHGQLFDFNCLLSINIRLRLTFIFMFPVKFKRCLRAVLDVVISSFDRKVQSISLYTVTNRSAHIKSHVWNYTSLPHYPHNVTQVRLSIASEQ